MSALGKFEHLGDDGIDWDIHGAIEAIKRDGSLSLWPGDRDFSELPVVRERSPQRARQAQRHRYARQKAQHALPQPKAPMSDIARLHALFARLSPEQKVSFLPRLRELEALAASPLNEFEVLFAQARGIQPTKQE